jgi:hypothetical protein
MLDGWRQSGVCWRFTLLLNNPDILYPFSQGLRRNGFHISNLYWPLSELFPSPRPCDCAEELGRRVVNLWVDRSVDEQWVRACAAALLTAAQKLDS